MATSAPEGIMSLPENSGMDQGPRLSLEESADAINQGLMNASPQASAAVKQAVASMLPMFDALTDEQLDMFIQLMQYLYDNPEQYQAALKELEAQEGFEKGLLPEEHDPQLLATMIYAALEAKRSRGGSMPEQASVMEPPVGMAMGGIAEAARMVASKGRGRDTVLAHITPEEARLLRSRGGMGTINPYTGLPEYGFFKDLWEGVKKVFNGVVRVAKQVVESPVGRILATVALTAVLGPVAGAFAAPLASAGTTLLAGGDLKDALVAGATAYFGAPGGAVSNFVKDIGVTNMALNAAVTQGVVGTAGGLLTGKSLEESVKQGLTQGVIGGANAVAGQVAQGKTLGQALREKLAVDAATPTPDSPLAEPGKTGGMDIYEGLSPEVETPAAVQARINEQVSLAPKGTQVPPPQAPAAQTNLAMQAGKTGAMDIYEGLPPPTQGPVPYQPTTVSGQLGKMGSALMDGEFRQAYDAGKELLFPTSPTNAQVQAQRLDTYKNSYAAAKQSGMSDSAAQSFAQDAIKNITADSMGPGMMRTYGPGVVAGIGALGLMGGFKPVEAPRPGLIPTETGRDLIRRDPKQYLVQDLPGVEYDESGNIIGSKPYSPKTPLSQIVVPGVGQPTYQAAPTYQRPSGAVGIGSVAQPYNTASMYSNLMGGQGAAPQTSAYGSRFMPGSAPYNDIFAGVTRGYTPTPAIASPGSYAPRNIGFEGPISAPTPMPGGSLPFPLDPNLSPLDPRNATLFGPGFNFGAIKPAGSYADGGIASLMGGGYPRRTGQISGPGTETSDDVPAMLSDGEFVMTAKAVRGMGNGSRRDGAKKMYALMHQLERNAGRG